MADERTAADQVRLLGALYGNRRQRLPSDWRERLPSPRDYYPAHLDGIAVEGDTATAPCPFHPGHRISVALDGMRGLWRCPNGEGDMIAFHSRRTGLRFPAVVHSLIAGGGA